MEQQAKARSSVASHDATEWWPFANELPHWHVWRGINGLLYARRAMSSPPLVVRGEDAADLRNRMRGVHVLR